MAVCGHAHLLDFNGFVFHIGLASFSAHVVHTAGTSIDKLREVSYLVSCTGSRRFWQFGRWLELSWRSLFKKAQILLGVALQ